MLQCLRARALPVTRKRAGTVRHDARAGLRLEKCHARRCCGTYRGYLSGMNLNCERDHRWVQDPSHLRPGDAGSLVLPVAVMRVMVAVPCAKARVWMNQLTS